MRQQAIFHARPISDRSADAFRVAAHLEMDEAHLRALGADWRDAAVWRLATRDMGRALSDVPRLSAARRAMSAKRSRARRRRNSL